MTYTLHIVPSTERQFQRLHRQVQNRIERKLSLLAADARPHGSQKLHGTHFFRIRIGDYRVIYEIDDVRKIVTILDVGHRREVYRGW